MSAEIILVLAHTAATEVISVGIGETMVVSDTSAAAIGVLAAVINTLVAVINILVAIGVIIEALLDIVIIIDKTTIIILVVMVIHINPGTLIAPILPLDPGTPDTIRPVPTQLIRLLLPTLV